MPVEEKTCELVGVRPTATGLCTREQLSSLQVAAALAEPGPHFADPPDDAVLGPRARQLSCNQTLYWNDARDAALPLGKVGALALVHHGDAACFAPEFVDDALGGRVDSARLVALGYVLRDGLWWQADATHHFAPAAQFSQLSELVRSDGAVTRSTYVAMGSWSARCPTRSAAPPRASLTITGSSRGA